MLRGPRLLLLDDVVDGLLECVIPPLDPADSKRKQDDWFRKYIFNFLRFQKSNVSNGDYSAFTNFDFSLFRQYRLKIDAPNHDSLKYYLRLRSTLDDFIKQQQHTGRPVRRFLFFTAALWINCICTDEHNSQEG